MCKMENQHERRWRITQLVARRESGFHSDRFVWKPRHIRFDSTDEICALTRSPKSRSHHCRPETSSLNTNRAALINGVDIQPWLSDYQPLSAVHLWFKWRLQPLHSWWNYYLLVWLVFMVKVVWPCKLSVGLFAEWKSQTGTNIWISLNKLLALTAANVEWKRIVPTWTPATAIIFFHH